MPRLIIINGLPASGKSTLAAKLSAELGYPAFAKDDFKELIADTIGYTDHESTQKFGKASFVALFFVAKRCIEKGVSVIIEGNFSLGEETKTFLSDIQKTNAKVQEVICHTKPELLNKRFKERIQDPSRHSVHNTLGEKELNAWMERTFAGTGKIEPLTTGKLLEVDTTEFTEEQYQKVLEFLRA